MHEWIQYTHHSQLLSHVHTHIQRYEHVYTQSVPNSNSSCIITLFHRKTVARKIDIFFPLKHSIGYLIFMLKWHSLSTGVLAYSNQVQPHKDKQSHAIYFYQQGMTLLTVGKRLLFVLPIFFVLEPHWYIIYDEKYHHLPIIKWFIFPTEK